MHFSVLRQVESESKYIVTTPALKHPIYYKNLDYLRAALATTVYISHAGLSSWEHLGKFSVQVFFALSGFLIGNIILECKFADLPRFYFNRSTRIWIPYYLFLSVLLILTLIKGQSFNGVVSKMFVYKTTFSYNFFGPPQLSSVREQMPLQGTGNHVWSICVEEQFYLFAPLVLIFLKKYLFIFVPFLTSILFLGVPETFGSIALGLLLAWSKNYWMRLFNYQIIDSYKIGLVAIALLVAFFSKSLHIQALCAATIVLFLAQPGTQTSWGKTIGGISFPLYLYQFVGLFLIKPINRVCSSILLAHVIAFSTALFFSWLHYIFIDSYIQRVRNRYFSERIGKVFAFCGYIFIILGFFSAYLYGDLTLWNK